MKLRGPAANRGGTRSDPRLGLQFALAGGVAGGIVDALLATARWRIEGAEHYLRVVDAGNGGIFAFWHAHVLVLGHLHRGGGHSIMISRSKDGDYGAALARHWGQVPVRGSSSRGGSAALGTLIDHLEARHSAVFLPDGPRGPRNEVKPGVIVAAQRTGVPIVPIAAGTSRAWLVGSWDRMLIPKPFARVRVCSGAPFFVTPVEDVEERRRALEVELNRLTALADGGVLPAVAASAGATPPGAGT